MTKQSKHSLVHRIENELLYGEDTLKWPSSEPSLITSWLAKALLHTHFKISVNM